MLLRKPQMKSIFERPFFTLYFLMMIHRLVWKVYQFVLVIPFGKQCYLVPFLCLLYQLDLGYKFEYNNYYSPNLLLCPNDNQGFNEDVGILCYDGTSFLGIHNPLNELMLSWGMISNIDECLKGVIFLFVHEENVRLHEWLIDFHGFFGSPCCPCL